MLAVSFGIVPRGLLRFSAVHYDSFGLVRCVQLLRSRFSTFASGVSFGVLKARRRTGKGEP